MSKVYLAGSMEGVTEEEAQGWRNYCTVELSKKGIVTLDPCRRTSYRDSDMGSKENARNRIVKQDLKDIYDSTVLLVDLRDSTPGRKWGTICEMAHAHTKNKIIIIVMDTKEWVHPFVGFYATEIHTSLDDAIRAVVSYFE